MTELSRDELGSVSLVHFALLHFIRFIFEAGLWVGSFKRTT
jgi:hypothetical protein